MKVVFLITFLLVTAHCTPVSKLLMFISANQPLILKSSKKKKNLSLESKSQFFGAKSSSFKVSLKTLLEGFPAGPVAKIPSSPGRGPGFYPWSGN